MGWNWRSLLGLPQKVDAKAILEDAIKEDIIKSELIAMGNVIYKPDRKYIDENGEVKIPDEAIAVQRQTEEMTIKDSGMESKGIRIYYSYLIPVSQEAEPEPEAREEPKKPVILARKR